MTRKNVITILICLMSSMILLSACSGEIVSNAAPLPVDASEPVAAGDDDLVNLRFTIWSGNEAHLAMLNDFAEAYRELHPNVTIQFDTILPADYIDKITVQLAGSNPPDAGWVHETSAPAFIKAGVLADLTSALQAYPDYDLADMSKSAMQLWQHNEAVYGIPFSTSPFLILYNRDLFESAGVDTPDVMLANHDWTWTALAKAAKQIGDVSPPGVYGFESKDAAVYGAGVWHTLVPIMRIYGGEAWNAEGTQCLLDSPESVEAVQLYHDMVFVDGSAVPPGGQGDFYSGQSAMTIAQLSRVGRLKDAPFKWGIAPLPSGPAGEKPAIGQAGIAVFNASQHKEEAIDFVAFMTNKENVTRMAQFFPPARMSVLKSDDFLKANPLVDPEIMDHVVVRAIEEGTVLSNHVEFPNIDLTAQVQFDNLWHPDANVSETLSNICDALAPFFDQ